MWYNPDLMENRQRAIFMAGCDYLLPELVSCAVGLPLSDVTVEFAGGYLTLSGNCDVAQTWMHDCSLVAYDKDGNVAVDDKPIDFEDGDLTQSFQAQSFSRAAIVGYTNHSGYFFVEL
jgi:hypothetical protein